MTPPQTITYEVTDRVARIALNRPERGNGITRRLLSELERCVERADLDPAVHVIVLSGNGKGFCGGYDLVESAEGQGRLDEKKGRPDKEDERLDEKDSRPEEKDGRRDKEDGRPDKEDGRLDKEEGTRKDPASPMDLAPPWAPRSTRP